MWWRTPLTLALGKQKQGAFYEMEASLAYAVCPRLKTKQEKKQTRIIPPKRVGGDVLVTEHMFKVLGSIPTLASR